MARILATIAPVPRPGKTTWPAGTASRNPALRNRRMNPTRRRSVRKLISFDDETANALKLLGADRRKSLQNLADEAFADLLRKHGRPVRLKDALRQSLRDFPANDGGHARSKR